MINRWMQDLYESHVRPETCTCGGTCSCPECEQLVFELGAAWGRKYAVPVIITATLALAFIGWELAHLIH